MTRHPCKSANDDGLAASEFRLATAGINAVSRRCSNYKHAAVWIYYFLALLHSFASQPHCKETVGGRRVRGSPALPAPRYSTRVTAYTFTAAGDVLLPRHLSMSACLLSPIIIKALHSPFFSPFSATLFVRVSRRTLCFLVSLTMSQCLGIVNRGALSPGAPSSSSPRRPK